MLQGNLANRSGNTLEQTVISVFQSIGFQLAKYTDWERNPARFGAELLLKGAPYTSIYNHSGKTEFLLVSARHNRRIRIECKWQQSSGSVDEKFPYLYLNCIEAMPEKEIILIIDGNGYKPGAMSWIKETTQSHRYDTSPVNEQKNIRVFTLSEFIAWAHREFR